MPIDSVENDGFRVVIPARLNSTRLPGKVLLDIAGKPLVQHVWEQSISSGAEQVVIATDDSRVADVSARFGATVCMTSAECRSGTDRVAEVCRELSWSGDKPVVNLQGDAPLMPPASIRSVASLLRNNPDADMATLCVGITSHKEYLDPNVVKVVFDKRGRALYFSRSPIPADSHGTGEPKAWSSAWRHLGLYAYRAQALQRLASAEPCELEALERLEQLRAMWMGMTIMIAPDSEDHGPDVDTEEDLRLVAAYLVSKTSGH